MTTGDQKPMQFGWRVYGLGIVAFGIIGFVWGDFISGQPVPKWFPERGALAYAAAAFLAVAGLAIEWRKTVTWAAAALVAYYGLIVLLLMNGNVILKNYTVAGAYTGAAEPFAIAAGAAIVYTATANIDAPLAARLTRLTRLAQLAFGICAILFGVAHFVYMNYTAPLIPTWLPPSQIFWGYATGVFHILSGIAILTGIRARLAAILAAVMYGSFVPLVFVPVLMTEPSAFRWTELATTVVLIGVAWTVADSFKRR